VDELIVAVLRDERREVQFHFRAGENVHALVADMDFAID